MSAPGQFAGPLGRGNVSLGARFVLLALVALGLMLLDRQEDHLQRVRQGLSVAVYPIRVLVDLPFSLWQSASESLAERRELLLENERLRRETMNANYRLQRLAALDGLTGLNNRRHFFDIAYIEFSRARRYGHPLSAMLLDIDHFKDFNDNFGHAIGDQVLQEVANCCRQSLRQTDILGRYGGEEFVILLPETDRHIALTVAERLRKTIARTTISTEKGDLGVTVSIGTAENNEYTPDLETLIARADQAMYIAKHKGRNQVATSI